MDPDAVWDGKCGPSGDGCVRRVVIVEGEGSVLGMNLGRPAVNNGDSATRLFPNYFGQDLLEVGKNPHCIEMTGVHYVVCKRYLRRSVLAAVLRVRHCRLQSVMTPASPLSSSLRSCKYLHHTLLLLQVTKRICRASYLTLSLRCDVR